MGEGVAGYVTPKVAVSARWCTTTTARSCSCSGPTSGIWLYPTGWADVGYSASEVAVKEVHEETGIDCEPVRLIAVLDGLRLGFTRVPLYCLVFLCRATGGELDGAPARDPGRRLVRRRRAAPSRWPGAPSGGEHAFRAIQGEDVGVLYDEPRRPWGRGSVARRRGSASGGRASIATLVAWPATGVANFSSLVRCHRPSRTSSRRTSRAGPPGS